MSHWHSVLRSLQFFFSLIYPKVAFVRLCTSAVLYNLRFNTLPTVLVLSRFLVLRPHNMLFYSGKNDWKETGCKSPKCPEWKFGVLSKRKGISWALLYCEVSKLRTIHGYVVFGSRVFITFESFHIKKKRNPACIFLDVKHWNSTGNLWSDNWGTIYSWLLKFLFL